jgi:hypothetical protein
MQVRALILGLDEAAKRLALEEPADLGKVRRGSFPEGTTQEFRFPARVTIDGMLRDYSVFSLNAVLKLARNKVLHPGQQHAVFQELSRPYFNFFRSFRFEELCGNIQAVDDAIAGGLETEDFNGVVEALYRLSNRYASWSFHFFPWQPDSANAMEEPSRAAVNANAEALTPTATRIRLSWKPLDITVEAWLATDRNPALCDEFLAGLPFTVLQHHAVVAGQSMLAWTPLVVSAPVPFTEIIRMAPVGRLRYSQATGQKIVVQYGATTENIAAPVLGGVMEHDRHLLPQVGRAIWQSTFVDKSCPFLTVERL